VEVYDSATGQFATATGQLDASRFFMVATRLPDGQVLITGGYDYSIQATAKVWLFTPGP
jgi:hypothetical protein